MTDERGAQKAAAESSQHQARSMRSGLAWKARSLAGRARAMAGRTHKAARWILAIGAVQIVFGGMSCLSQVANCDRALQTLANLPGEQIRNGMTVAESRRQIELAMLLAFEPIALGIAFLGLFLWCHRAAVPATLTALILYVVASTLSVALDPGQDTETLVWSLVFLVGLGFAVRAAFAQRLAELSAAAARRRSLALPVDATHG